MSGGAGAAPASDYVRLERRDDVAIVTLDHPSDRNALSLNMIRALAEVVEGVADDAGVGALIVAGEGPVFSAGGSVDDLFEPKAPLVEMYAGVVAVSRCGLPTIAAVNGPALGAGLNLALACDLIVCSPAARFASPFLTIGLHPGGGHLWHLRERIGRQGAAALSLFGESVDGEEAARIGLAWRCVPESDLMAVVLEYASRVAKLDRPLVARARTALDDSAGVHRSADAIELELPVQQWSMERPEFQEALGRLRARLGRGK